MQQIQIQIQTSYFAVVDSSVPGAISISRSMPRWDRSYPVYPLLAPGGWFKSVPEDEYRRLYAERLELLDPIEVLDDLVELAPGPWFKTVEESEYRRLYAEQLALLDPQQVLDDLVELARQHALNLGTDPADVVPTMLCFEKSGEFCHRRLVADWLSSELGLVVPEVKWNKQAQKFVEVSL